MLTDWLLILLLIQKLEKLKKKVPDIIRLVTNTALNIQIEEVKKNSWCYWISTKIGVDEETFLMILNIYS